MKCPHCDKEIDGPVVVGPLQLKCPECEQTVAQLDLIFEPDELGVFNDILVRVIEDSSYYEKLRQDPLGVLQGHGISEDTVSRLTEVIDELGVPVIAACIVNPDSWPDIEFPEIESPENLSDEPGEFLS
jgi:hypothetical protein